MYYLLTQEMVNIVNIILIDFNITVLYILSSLHLNIERPSLPALSGGGGRTPIRDRFVGRRETIVMIHSGFFRPTGRNVTAPIEAAAVIGFSNGAIADDGTAHRDELARIGPLGEQHRVPSGRRFPLLLCGDVGCSGRGHRQSEPNLCAQSDPAGLSRPSPSGAPDPRWVSA